MLLLLCRFHAAQKSVLTYIRILLCSIFSCILYMQLLQFYFAFHRVLLVQFQNSDKNIMNRRSKTEEYDFCAFYRNKMNYISNPNFFQPLPMFILTILTAETILIRHFCLNRQWKCCSKTLEFSNNSFFFLPYTEFIANYIKFIAKEKYMIKKTQDIVA